MVDPVTAGSIAAPFVDSFLGGAGSGLAGSIFGGGGGRGNYGIGQSTTDAFGQTGSSSSGYSSTYRAPDFISPDQLPYLQQLWGAGAGLMGAGAGQDVGQQVFNQTMTGMQNILNPGSNPMLDVYAQDLGQAFNQNILPGIRRDAVGAGQLGGGRQGIAEGLAGQEMARQLSTFGARQYQADMDRMLQGLGQMPGIGQFGMGIPWYGLNQQAGLLGSPVVLGGEMTSESQDSSSSFGFDQSTTRSFDSSGPKRGWVEDQFYGSQNPALATNRTFRDR